jgi:hypothetical protein
MDKKQCKAIQAILIQRCYDDIAQDDWQRVEKHLAGCETCQKFQQVLAAVAQSQKIETMETTAEAEHVKQSVVKALKKRNQTKAVQKTWALILGLLKYKIPLYQSLTVVIILFIFFLQRTHLPTGEQEGDRQITDSLQTAPVPDKFSYIIDNIEIIEAQRVGEAVKDDSALFEFSYSVF